MNRRRLSKLFFKTISSFGLSKKCFSCKKSADDEAGFLCSDCWGRLRQSMVNEYCRRCGKQVSQYGKTDDGCPGCVGQEYHFDRIACAGVYGDVLRGLLLRLKFGDAVEVGDLLGGFARLAFERADFAESTECIVPVPLHWRRRWRRGYNQSLMLAEKIASGKIGIDKSLVRIRNTVEQGKLSGAKRKKNVQGAFAVKGQSSLAGRSVCLVDDIKTTGATLNKCAKVLKAAGAKKVFAVVVATAGQ